MSTRRGLPNEEDAPQPYLPAGALPVLLGGLAVGGCVVALFAALKLDPAFLFAAFFVLAVVAALLTPRLLRTPSAARSEMVLPISVSAVPATVERILRENGIRDVQVRGHKASGKGRLTLLSFGSEVQLSWSENPDGNSSVVIEACPPVGVFTDYGTSRRLVERLRSALAPDPKLHTAGANRRTWRS